ncbi:FadR/GntR family transcriptional regulator [Hydrogenoanaerobacterium sp.]|uniref:FadR/GntR family transcriptional regulator n=1 Tax=Hydrogenoanaerobacterium sp. TaxID=2953763 RepID=UPI002899AA47|nr:FadR/GntR family transcriptional regulator [Hydrogenoanaerobacterium sp.]
MAQSNSLLTASLANKSVVDRVVDQITAAIISGELKPGDKIPTEVELCESFQVGRNSVREAIKVLASFGVVYIKRSEGTYVSEKFNHRMLEPMLYGLILQKDSATEIMELRQVFDTGIIQVVAEKVTPAALKQIKAAFTVLEKEILRSDASPQQTLDADIMFHNAVIEAANNVLIANIAGYIDRITIPSRVRTMDKILTNGKQADFIELHKRIVDVIENGRTDHIAQTVKDHYQFWKVENIPEQQLET